MSAIITPELVKRYILATGPKMLAAACPSVPESIDAFIDDLRMDRAVLGMLAAAEMVREEAQGYEVKSTDEDGPREALLDVASKFIEAAGVDPKAWEKARGA